MRIFNREIGVELILNEFHHVQVSGRKKYFWYLSPFIQNTNGSLNWNILDDIFIIRGNFLCFNY